MGAHDDGRAPVAGISTSLWQQLGLVDGAKVRVSQGEAQAVLPARADASLPANVVRVAAGHPEGFPEAFANLYSDAAEAIAARRAGQAPDPLALHFPNAHDGWMGMRFVDAVIRSSQAGGAWTAA